ncbi:hypothetical protein N9054_01020, partial [bacterium]|nr:hypothetical protein [bacterium]
FGGGFDFFFRKGTVSIGINGGEDGRCGRCGWARFFLLLVLPAVPAFGWFGAEFVFAEGFILILIELEEALIDSPEFLRRLILF